MSLPSGVRLGPYEVLGLIGTGGMGEVYRARDTRLERTVAVKVLPESFANEPALRARFEREARAVSALAHPHICTLHDVGEQDGRAFLVMEYLDGGTLAERLRKGPLPLPEALSVASQIADALGAAHKQGIVHRDLKPGNVMLTKQGVKLLDFGVARFTGHGERAAIEDRTSAPTESLLLTSQGTLLGTVPYMAPEQLEGKTADARTDLWALGAIIYEMVSGRRAFEGQSQASVIGAILEREPAPLSTLQPLTPPSLERLVRRCLAKSPDERWDSAHDVADELRWIAGAGAEAAAAPSGVASGSRRGLILGLLAVALAAGAVLGGVAARRLLAAATPRPPVVRSLLDVSPAEQVRATGGGSLWLPTPAGSRTAIAWVPGGESLVFVGRVGEVQRLYVRALGSEEARPLPGTEGAQVPAVSPDGQRVAFWADGAIRVVPLAGGPVGVLVKEAESRPAGLAWMMDGRVVWGSVRGPIMSAAAEQAPSALTQLLEGELSHLLPQMLPEQDVLLYTVRHREWTWGDEEVVAQVLATGQRKAFLTDAADARFVSPGWLVFMRRGALMAVGFDASRLELRGTPIPVLDGVVQALTAGNLTDFTGAGQFAVSSTGSLAYLRGAVANYPEARLVTIDRQGRIRPLDAPTRTYTPVVAVSPDGRRLAVRIRSVTENDCWIYDLERGTLDKLTTTGECQLPRWTPDGQSVSFAWLDKGRYRLARRRADGSAELEVLLAREDGMPCAWAPDGKHLALWEDADLWMATIEAGKVTRVPYLQAPSNEWGPEFSPDGRWLAYTSDVSGRPEVYVQPAARAGPRLQVSLEGGSSPAWSANGTELFFVSARLDPEGHRTGVMAAGVHSSSTLEVTKPRQLFEFDQAALGFAMGFACVPSRCYSVSPDGQRFYAVQQLPTAPPAAVTQVHLIQNWTEELTTRIGAR